MIDQNNALLYWADGVGTLHSKLLTPEGFGPILNISNITASGLFGTAASTVDQYNYFRINQTTSGISISFPTPTLTGATRQCTLVNVGTVAFYIFLSYIPPGCRVTGLWNPNTQTWTQSFDIDQTARTQIYTSNIFVNTNDFVSYNNIQYKYVGNASIINTAPISNTLWYPQSRISASWYATSAQSVANNAATYMNFQNQYTNTDNSFITTSTTGLTITLPITGIYEIKCTIEWAGISTVGYRNIALLINGSPNQQFQSLQSSATEFTQFAEFIYKANAGDTVQIACNQTSGASINTLFNAGISNFYQTNRLYIALISPQ